MSQPKWSLENLNISGAWLQGTSQGLLLPRRSRRSTAMDSGLSESSHFRKGVSPVLLSAASLAATEGEEHLSPCCGPSAKLGAILGGASPPRRLPPRLEIPNGAHDDPQVRARSLPALPIFVD